MSQNPKKLARSDPARALGLLGGPIASTSRPRRAAAIFSMVDLLSCAFGGALFLFMLTAVPPAALQPPPEATSRNGYLEVKIFSTMVRPIFVLRQENTGIRFVVDGKSLSGSSWQRQVKKSGAVWAIGATPWDAKPGSGSRELRLRFGTPTADQWCIRYGTADDDSRARERGINQVEAAPIEIRILKPGETRWRPVETQAAPSIEPNLGVSECVYFSF